MLRNAGRTGNEHPSNGWRPRSRDRSMRAIVVALTVLVLSGRAPHSAADSCDPRLVQPPSDPNGYRLRGDRCEGIFIQQVSGSASLAIVSFTQRFADFNPRQENELVLDWTPAAESKPTRLRAYGLRRRQYYRMDAERPAGNHTYRWPTTILGNLDISKRFLGVVAWNEIEVGAQTRPVYLPIRVGAERPRAGQPDYELMVVSDVELTEIYLGLGAIDAAGRAARYLWKDRALGYGYYPPDQGIRIPISGLDSTGLYRLEIAVTQRDGGTANTELWFRHAGR